MTSLNKTNEKVNEGTPFYVPHRFEEQIVVITASTAGIGYEAARRFAMEGAEVILSSRKAENVQEAVKRLQKEIDDLKIRKLNGSILTSNVSGIVCHVAVKSQCEELVKFATKNYTRCIDHVISNAAVSPYYGRTIDTEESVFDKIFEVNLKASLYLIQSFHEHMNDGGSVVFIGSAFAYIAASPIGLYGVSKLALSCLTRILAKDLYPIKKIRVNCIAPGVIKTEFSRPLWEPGGSIAHESLQNTFSRPGEVSEVSGPITFLCSNDASFITGETIVVDGCNNTSRL